MDRARSRAAANRGSGRSDSSSVTIPKFPAGLTYRYVDTDDAALLERFECSCGAPYEEEVQQYIRSSALRDAAGADSPVSLMLTFHRDRLVGIAGYSVEFLLAGPRGPLDKPPPLHEITGMDATRLWVLALSREAQGRKLRDGRRLSTLVMDTLIAEAMGGRDRGLLTAIVARENLRSLALCERSGLRSQTMHDPRHVRLSGYFSRAN
jgi:hypothetical protein